jgi:UDP-glucose 4-epimerase
MLWTVADGRPGSQAMKILVTGGAGFIGSHVVDAYLAAGHDVQVLDNLATGRRANVPRGVNLHEVDIHSNQAERIFDAFRPDVVNHHAAQASVKLSTEDIVHDLEVNGGGTARVADLCVRYGVGKLIHVSTGGALYGEPVALPVNEDHPVAPISNYGVSKRVGELYVDLMERTCGLRATVLRYGNAYGPRQDPNGEAGVVAIFLARMLAGKECTIDGDGEQAKDYVYVADLARANLLALDRGDGQVFNIGTGQGTTVNAIFTELQRATGSTMPARFGPPRPGDVRKIWLDAHRAEAILCWKPEVTLAEGLAKTVAAFR